MELLPERADECELLKGEYKGQRKFEVWPYRVRFIIEKNKAKIVRIGHRREIYRIK
jgi:mRNA-degrading endonuclease RelE of RelBE toxin-antitoxin system